jgi:hypothetical protein
MHSVFRSLTQTVAQKRNDLLIGAGTLAAAVFVGLAAQPVHASDDAFEFNLVRPKALKEFPKCVPYAAGKVRIEKLEGVERMRMKVTGLPKDTGFDVFVIQVPNAPFGMAWYQGDIETRYRDKYGFGKGYQRFIGRFNEETFIVAQDVAKAPVVHNDPPFPDAHFNPPTEPIHTFHIGVWFNSPDDAGKAGCPKTVTRFNGDHNAGIQVLNSDGPGFEEKGPLFFVKP